MNNTLQCHSQSGEIGRQFSAFNAILPCGRSIEQVYQAAKRDHNGNSYPVGKGKLAFFMYINGKNILCTGEHANIRYEFYTMLWALYFHFNPEKLKVAQQYDGFSDKFASRGKIYQPSDKPIETYITGGGCNQAASIAYLVATHGNMWLGEELKKAWDHYCSIYSRNIVTLILP